MGDDGGGEEESGELGRGHEEEREKVWEEDVGVVTSYTDMKFSSAHVARKEREEKDGTYRPLAPVHTTVYPPILLPIRRDELAREAPRKHPCFPQPLAHGKPHLLPAHIEDRGAERPALPELEHDGRRGLWSGGRLLAGEVRPRAGAAAGVEDGDGKRERGGLCRAEGGVDRGGVGRGGGQW